MKVQKEFSKSYKGIVLSFDLFNKNAQKIYFQNLVPELVETILVCNKLQLPVGD